MNHFIQMEVQIPFVWTVEVWSTHMTQGKLTEHFLVWGAVNLFFICNREKRSLILLTRMSITQESTTGWEYELNYCMVVLLCVINNACNENMAWSVGIYAMHCKYLKSTSCITVESLSRLAAMGMGLITWSLSPLKLRGTSHLIL